MQRTTPLHEHPEFTILESSAWTEYRVETRRHYSRSATSLFVRPDALVALTVALLWNSVLESRLYVAGLVTLVLLYVHRRCSELLWESVVVFPSLGLQLETSKGFIGIPLSVSRRFIPLSSLEDFLINEGLWGWNVRYYAVAIHRSPLGAIKLDVAFENLLPKFPVLLEVYHGVQDNLLSPASRKLGSNP